MGQGVSEENVLGPLQNAAQQKLLLIWSKRPAKMAPPLSPVATQMKPDRYFYPATIVSDIDQKNLGGRSNNLVRHCRSSNTTILTAIEWANELEVGLGSSVWSSDADRAREVANRLIAGTTWINKHGAVDPRVPFGGVKKSGMGLEFGVEGLKQVALPKVTTL